MKRKRCKPEQIISKLADAETALASGKDLGAVCQMLGMTKQTYYRWKKTYGDMSSEEARRLKSLEIENMRLKRLLADSNIDNLILREALEISKKV
jgi:uncharacterized protein (DUF2384 family)